MCIYIYRMKYSSRKYLDKVKNNTKHKYYTDIKDQGESDCLCCETKKQMKHLRTKKEYKKTEESTYKKNIKKTTHKDIFKEHSTKKKNINKKDMKKGMSFTESHKRAVAKDKKKKYN